MFNSLKIEALKSTLLPIVFTSDAWRRAIQPDGAIDKLHADRLSRVLRAAFEAHIAFPHAPRVTFEVVQTAQTNHVQDDPLLKLSLTLLHEPKQPSILLIDLEREHQLMRPHTPPKKTHQRPGIQASHQCLSTRSVTDLRNRLMMPPNTRQCSDSG